MDGWWERFKQEQVAAKRKRKTQPKISDWYDTRSTHLERRFAQSQLNRGCFFAWIGCDMLMLICNQLHWIDKLNLGSTCKFFVRFINHNQHWKDLAFDLFGLKAAESSLRNLKIDFIQHVKKDQSSRVNEWKMVNKGEYSVNWPRSWLLSYDKAYILRAFRHDVRILYKLGDNLLNDKDFLMEVIPYSPSLYRNLPSHMKSDSDIALAAIEKFMEAFIYIPYDVRSAEFMLAAVQLNPSVFQYASIFHADCWIIAFFAVRLNGEMLQHVSPQWKRDYHIVLAAIKSNPHALKYVYPTMPDYISLVSKAISINALTLKYAAAWLQDDEKLVSDAVQRNGLALQFASENMRSNERVIWLALKQNIRSFNFITEKCIVQPKYMDMKMMALNEYDKEKRLKNEEEAKKERDVIVLD